MNGGMPVIAKGEIVKDNGVHRGILKKQSKAQPTPSHKRAEAATAQSNRPAILQPRGDIPGLGHASIIFCP